MLTETDRRFTSVSGPRQPPQADIAVRVIWSLLAVPMNLVDLAPTSSPPSCKR
jgi:hypothetical protein